MISNSTRFNELPSLHPKIFSFFFFLPFSSSWRPFTRDGKWSVFCPLCRRGSRGLRVERLPDNRPSRRNSLLGGQGAGGGRGGDVEGDRRRGCRFPGQRSNASGQRGIWPWSQVIARRKGGRKIKSDMPRHEYNKSGDFNSDLRIARGHKNREKDSSFPSFPSLGWNVLKVNFLL